MIQRNKMPWTGYFLQHVLFLVVFFSFSSVLLGQAEERVVKVGIYENAPKVFSDESGRPAGVFIDIIEEIAKREGWTLRYVHGTWGEGLDRLERGELDLMTDVAFTVGRDKIYAFHTVPVLSSWYQVYAPKGSGIQSILDLNGKRILVLERSVQQAAFVQLSKGFGLNSTVIPVPDYKTMFEMVARGDADAAITNRFYGMVHARKLGLEETTVVFEPSDLFFAAPKNASRALLDAIDRHLSAMKKEPGSVYYASLKRWTAEEIRFKLPAWLQMFGLIVGVALVMSAAGGFVLKHQVNVRTRELRASEQRYRQLFENNPAPMLIYERGTFRLLAVNDAFTHHYGYTAEQALSLHLPDLYPDEEKAAIVEVAARLKGHAYAGEWHHLKADGSLITIVARSHDIDYWGQDARIAVITDISDRKRAEEALRASEERFFKAFHATPDAIVISRVSDGLLLDVNDVFLRKLGYSREDIVDRKTVDLNVWVNSDDRERYITGVREQGRVRDMEAQFLSRTGAILDGLVSGETLMIGGELCLLTIVRDISERKKIERELEQHRIRLEEMVSERTAELEKSQLTLLKLVDDLNAKKDELAIAMEKAQAADQIKSSFLATMSHELRTPLNSIIGFTGILLQGLAGPLNQEQHKQMTMVQNSSRHLLALINDVLDISKIEAGELVLSPAPFDLRQSLEKTVRMVAPLAEKKGIALHLDIEDTIGAITADQRRLEQVMLNLLNNAVKFTDKGHVRISCGEEDAHYILSFADTGIGIRPEDIPNLFQPFRQIDSGLTRKHEGTGLGLSICKKIIDMMGGSISVESRWGEGSVFTVRLSKQSGGQS